MKDLVRIIVNQSVVIGVCVLALVGVILRVGNDVVVVIASVRFGL